MSGKNVTIYQESSDSDLRKKYEVRFYEDGTKSCECPASVYSSNRECKHVLRVKQRGQGYNAPRPAVKVFQFTHGDQTAVVADVDGGVSEGVNEALKVLGVNKELRVRRIV